MKSKKMITVMATTLFCLVFVGAMLAQGFESENSDETSAVDRTVPSTSKQSYMNVNLGVVGIQATKKPLKNWRTLTITR